jgi:hypothetical protein
MTTNVFPKRAVRLSRTSPLVQISALVFAAAFLGVFSSIRIRHAGDWLPTLPDHIGIWEATDTPISSETLETLGSPQAIGRMYNNAYNEPVEISVISAGSFTSYHDPTVCVSTNGFVLTSMKIFPIDGPGSGIVRAMVFRKTDPKYGTIRILMYYWQQTRDGLTATDAVMGSYRDIISRFKTGYGDVVQGKQVCLVRIYAPIGQEDHNGAQTQRNVDEIAKAVYHAMKQTGADNS